MVHVQVHWKKENETFEIIEIKRKEQINNSRKFSFFFRQATVERNKSIASKI